MQSAIAMQCPRASRPASSTFSSLAGSPAVGQRRGRSAVVVRAQEKASVVQPLNGDPFIGMLETPVTSSYPIARFLSNLPGYRTNVEPLYRGVEIGLAHGYLLPGPFIKYGPLRNVEAVAEKAGCLASAAVVFLLAVCLTIYGAVTFDSEAPGAIGLKSLSGRDLPKDPLQTSEGWTRFSAGFLVGGISGVAWCYVLSLLLPLYT